MGRPCRPNHKVELRDHREGWSMEHPPDCKVDGALLDCPVHYMVAYDFEVNGMPDYPHGRYIVNVVFLGDDVYDYSLVPEPVQEPADAEWAKLGRIESGVLEAPWGERFEVAPGDLFARETSFLTDSGEQRPLEVLPALETDETLTLEGILADLKKRNAELADTAWTGGRRHASVWKRAVANVRRHDRAGLLAFGSYAGMTAALAAYATGSDPLYLAASVGLGAFAYYRRAWAFVILNAVWGALALERIIR